MVAHSIQQSNVAAWQWQKCSHLPIVDDFPSYQPPFSIGDLWRFYDMFQEPSLPEGIIINQWIFGFFFTGNPSS